MGDLIAEEPYTPSTTQDTISIDGAVKKEDLEGAEELPEVKSEESCADSTMATEEVSGEMNEEYEKLFATRYTEEEGGYASIVKGFDPVVCVHPWADRPKRVFDHTRGGRGGGWRGGQRGGNWQNNYRGGGGGWQQNRGNWRGRGGGYRGDRGGGYRGDRGGGWKRRDDQGGPDNKRVYYPGRND